MKTDSTSCYLAPEHSSICRSSVEYFHRIPTKVMKCSARVLDIGMGLFHFTVPQPLNSNVPKTGAHRDKIPIH
uniref:Uncharacterized protein n=1 Tax=Anguilla anguilla TaxID=7936 RepID=A0A0E9VC45_ANGAN